MNRVKWLLCWPGDFDRLGQGSASDRNPTPTRIFICSFSAAVQLNTATNLKEGPQVQQSSADKTQSEKYDSATEPDNASHILTVDDEELSLVNSCF